MSDANYQALSDKLDEFKADVDKRIDGLGFKMNVMIGMASLLIFPIIAGAVIHYLGRI